MPIFRETIEKALKEQSPALYRQLKASGQLTAFLTEQTEEMNGQVAEMARGSDEVKAAQQSGNFLDVVRALNRQKQVAQELVFANMEFPQDATSLPRRGDT
jgi:hypothetical protein